VQEPAWGVLIVIYLFCGGLSAGALMLSAAAIVFGRADRHAVIARVGALVAPLPVIIGTGLLVFDLGRPFFFWKLFFAIRPLSLMWIGSWLLALFSAVSLAYAYLHLPRAWQRWPVHDAARWTRRLAILALPLALSVAVYTAILLGALVARPLWNTPLLSMLFVLSALSSGAAALMLFVPHAEQHVLSIADVVFLATEVVVIGALIFFGLISPTAARQAVVRLAGGEYGVLFWLGVVVVGLVVPFGIELRLLRRVGHSRRRAALAASLVLIGAFLLRYVLVYVGQQSALG
jgi:formate-dependent nitrite reductase membrane component NrfD